LTLHSLHIRRRVLGLVLMGAGCVCTSYAQSPSRESIAGDYHLERVMETASGLRLSPDGTYRFFLMAGSVDEVDQGNWRIENSHVVLQSTAVRQAPTFTFLRSSKEPGSPARVTFEGPDAQKVVALAHVAFIVNGLSVAAHKRRATSLEADSFDVPISKVSLSYLGIMRHYPVVEYRPKDQDHNHFVFGAVFGNHGFVRFDKLRLTIDGDESLRMSPPNMGREFRYVKKKSP
jgi:hypothetical protein